MFSRSDGLDVVNRRRRVPGAAVLGPGGRRDDVDKPDVAARLIGEADGLDARTGSAMWPADRVVAGWCLARLEDVTSDCVGYCAPLGGGALGGQAVAMAGRWRPWCWVTNEPRRSGRRSERPNRR